MKLIGFSGAQGQGKTTLIKELEQVDPYFGSIPLQTSREVLAEWNFTLSEVNQYMPLKVQFQETLLNNHCANIESQLAYLEDVSGGADMGVMVERTFADIFAYAAISLGPFNEYSQWFDEYGELCALAQEKYFDHVVYLTGRTYVPEDDGVRSTNEHFAHLADYMIRYYTEQYDTGNVTFINVPALPARVSAVQKIVKGD